MEETFDEILARRLANKNKPRTAEEKKAQRALAREKLEPRRAALRAEKRRNSEAEGLATAAVQGETASNFDTAINFHDDAAFREAQRAIRHERRTLLSCAGGEYTAEQWVALCTHYGDKCLRCGDPENLTVDHVKPVKLGGGSDISNLQPLCRSCNSWKGAREIDFRPK